MAWAAPSAAAGEAGRGGLSFVVCGPEQAPSPRAHGRAAPRCLWARATDQSGGLSLTLDCVFLPPHPQWWLGQPPCLCWRG